MYAQDEWSVSKNLKLTLALRAEKNSNPVCQTNCSSLLDGSFNQALSAGLLSESTPYNSIIRADRHQLYNATDAINWAPRFGFAWSPLGPSTVFRGGFGIFMDAFPAVVGDQFMTNLPGLVEVRIIEYAVGRYHHDQQPLYPGRELRCSHHVGIRQRGFLQ